jgi:predicted house-cleaning noncanonical NTP pyrophosphatase (MazG superfamily)
MKIQKLVRDNIPHKIEKNGEVAITQILSKKEYEIELLKKLQEEVVEFIESKNIEEMADIREVLLAIEMQFKLDPIDIEQVRIAKKSKNGGFEKRIYLEETKEHIK